MNYYDRILELLESSYQMPSGRGQAIAGERAAIRKYGSAAQTSLTAGGKAKAKAPERFGAGIGKEKASTDNRFGAGIRKAK